MLARGCRLFNVAAMNSRTILSKGPFFISEGRQEQNKQQTFLLSLDLPTLNIARFEFVSILLLRQ
jgi:hypothetical protein